MKEIYILLALISLAAKAQTTYFQQNFSAGGTTASYVSATPNSGQFTDVRGSVSNSLTVGISANALEYNRTINSGDASFTRTTDFSPEPTSLYIQFSFEMVSSDPSLVYTSAIIFAVGQAFTNGPTNPSNANTYARFSINTTATTGNYSFNSYPAGGGGSVSTLFSGKQLITFVLNRTGSNLNYNTPTGTLEIQPNDVYDLWVGTTKIFDDKPIVTAGAKITDFKMLFEKGIASIRFDDFLVRDISGILPVTLLNFTAKPEGDRVQLAWATTMERDADRFLVERSRDLKEYVPVGEVAAKGNTDERQYYGLTDINPLPGVNYYRLTQIDSDGTAHEFKPISAIIRVDEPVVSLYPNPANPDRIHVRLWNADNATIRLLTPMGQSINGRLEHQPGEADLIFDQPLSPGFYWLEVQTNDQKKVIKVLVR